VVFAQDPIKIEGLAKFNRDLKRMDKDLPKALRIAQNAAAEIVADWAAPRVPSLSGNARRSIRASSTRTEARVQGGNARRAPYYPWLDFGGKVGKGGRIHREFKKGGRFIYPGYAVNRDQVQDKLFAELIKLAESAGLGVENG
jgi:hypothetical protein